MHVVLSLNSGGLENVVFNLAANVDRKTFDVSVCCIDEFGILENKFKKLDINLVLLKRKKGGTDWLLCQKLAKLLKEQKVDILHTHNFAPNLYGAIAGRLSYTPKIIATYHNKRFFEDLNIKRLIVFKMLYYMNHVNVFVSEDAKYLAIKTSKISPNRITVIHNGVDINKFSLEKKKKDLLNELNINDGEFVIGTISRLSKEKNLATLLRLYRNILTRYNKCKLLIIGDGPEKEELIKKAFDLRIISKTIFTGYREDIPELLNIMDLFIMTSLTEGISLTLLEAMSARKAVIATMVGGNKEIITDGHSGILVKIKDIDTIVDKVIDLINDKEKRNIFTFNARRKVIQEFSLEKMVGKYNTLYLSTYKPPGALRPTL